jgi:hypothetical protein
VRTPPKSWLDVPWRHVGRIIESHDGIGRELRHSLMLGIWKLVRDSDEEKAIRENGADQNRKRHLAGCKTCPRCGGLYVNIKRHMKSNRRCLSRAK